MPRHSAPELTKSRLATSRPWNSYLDNIYFIKNGLAEVGPVTTKMQLVSVGPVGLIEVGTSQHAAGATERSFSYLS